MKRSTGWVILLLALGLALLSACTSPVPDSPTGIPDAAFTQAAETIIVEMTANAPTATGTPEPKATVPVIPPTETPTETLPPAATASPTLTPGIPTETVEPTEEITYNLVIDENFSSGTGWFTEEQDDFGFEFAEGGYRIYTSVADAVWSVRKQEFSDVRLEVDVVEEEGSSASFYGLVCRHENAGSYYAFAVNDEGFFGIARREGGELEFMAQGTAPEGVIEPAGAANRIVAECLGERLILSVNGHKLADVQDDEIDAGAIGLTAGNQSARSTTEALFDNFVARVPAR